MHYIYICIYLYSFVFHKPVRKHYFYLPIVDENEMDDYARFPQGESGPSRQPVLTCHVHLGDCPLSYQISSHLLCIESRTNALHAYENPCEKHEKTETRRC